MGILWGLILAFMTVSGFEENEQLTVSEEVKNILNKVRVGGAARPFANIEWPHQNTHSGPDEAKLRTGNYQPRTQKTKGTESSAPPVFPWEEQENPTHYPWEEQETPSHYPSNKPNP